MRRKKRVLTRERRECYNAYILEHVRTIRLFAKFQCCQQFLRTILYMWYSPALMRMAWRRGNVNGNSPSSISEIHATLNWLLGVFPLYLYRLNKKHFSNLSVSFHFDELRLQWISFIFLWENPTFHFHEVQIAQSSCIGEM